MFFLEFSNQAKRFLKKSDRHIQIRIVERLEKLKQSPVPSDSVFIGRDKNNDKIFRYRIGYYRSLYKIIEKKKIILITKIDKRPRVYN